MTKLVLGPFNRVEGDLEVQLELAEGRVVRAQVNAPLYRGFERMLTGKAALDALTITPRICGICSVSQSIATARALGDVSGAQMSVDGARVAALIHAVENVADHLTHFNLFFMPDFTRPCYAHRPWFARAQARFLAMDGSGARAAVAARAELLHILGLLAGKWPHTLAVQPWGVTKAPSARDLARIRAWLRAFRAYLERVMFGAPLEAFAALESLEGLADWSRGDVGLFIEIAQDLDLAALGRGAGRYLSFGAYPLAEGYGFARGLWADGGLQPLDLGLIREDVSHAWMLGESLHPAQGATEPDEEMRESAYSWCKAPRLGGHPVEVGALARQVIDGHPLARALIAGESSGGVLARVAARLLELARTQILMETLCDEIAVEARFMQDPLPLISGQGAGLTEAARGALGHWVSLDQGRITRYQIIAPTTWNFSPRDAQGVAGPLERALEGTLVEGEGSVAVQHIVRSFDPCMVCTVH